MVLTLYKRYGTYRNSFNLRNATQNFNDNYINIHHSSLPIFLREKTSSISFRIYMNKITDFIQNYKCINSYTNTFLNKIYASTTIYSSLLILGIPINDYLYLYKCDKLYNLLFGCISISHFINVYKEINKFKNIVKENETIEDKLNELNENLRIYDIELYLGNDDDFYARINNNGINEFVNNSERNIR